MSLYMTPHDSHYLLRSSNALRDQNLINDHRAIRLLPSSRNTVPNAGRAPNRDTYDPGAGGFRVEIRSSV
jgi:hypothetical protein